MSSCSSNQPLAVLFFHVVDRTTTSRFTWANHSLRDLALQNERCRQRGYVGKLAVLSTPLVSKPESAPRQHHPHLESAPEEICTTQGWHFLMSDPDQVCTAQSGSCCPIQKNLHSSAPPECL